MAAERLELPAHAPRHVRRGATRPRAEPIGGAGGARGLRRPSTPRRARAAAAPPVRPRAAAAQEAAEPARLPPPSQPRAVPSSGRSGAGQAGRTPPSPPSLLLLLPQAAGVNMASASYHISNLLEKMTSSDKDFRWGPRRPQASVMARPGPCPLRHRRAGPSPRAEAAARRAERGRLPRAVLAAVGGAGPGRGRPAWAEGLGRVSQARPGRRARGSCRSARAARPGRSSPCPGCRSCGQSGSVPPAWLGAASEAACVPREKPV